MSKILDIIMVARNNLDRTAEAITSMSKYTNHDLYRLIFMDNGSQDNTEEWVKDFCNNNDIELEYFYSSTNEGWITRVNEGYLISDAQFVLTCHQDVVFCKHWFENMARRFEDPTVGAVGPIVTFCMGLQRLDIAMMSFGVEVKFLLGLFFLCRRSVIEEVGPLPVEYGMGDKEELEYCYMIRKAGYRLEIARDVVIEHKGEKVFIDELGSQKAFHDYQKKQELILNKRLGNDVVEDIFKISTPKPFKILIGIPARDMMSHTYFTMAMLNLTIPCAYDLLHIPRGQIADSRNTICERAIDTDCTHVLMIDDDMVFQRDTLVKLLSRDVDICSGIAFQRAKPFLPVTFVANEDTKAVNLLEAIDTGFGEVDAVGTFFMLIKIEVLKAVPKPWFRYADTTLGFAMNDGGIGEDVYFCLKAKLNNFKVWVDSDLEIQHLGIAPLIGKKDYLENKAKDGIKKSDKKEEFILS